MSIVITLTASGENDRMQPVINNYRTVILEPQEYIGYVQRPLGNLSYLQRISPVYLLCLNAYRLGNGVFQYFLQRLITET